MDDVTVRKRLITNESVTAPLGPKRIATEYLSFVSSLQQHSTVSSSSPSVQSSTSTDATDDTTLRTASSSSSSSQIYRTYDKLLTTLAQYEFLVDKLQLIHQRYHEDQTHYAHLQNDIQQQMSTTQKDILNLKQQLEQARQTRAQRMDSENLAKTVNKHPTRDALHAQLLSLENDYQTTLQEQTLLDKKLEQRKLQFALLQSAIKDIGLTITEEATMERKRLEDQAKAAAMEAMMRKAETLQKLQQQKNNATGYTNGNGSNSNDNNMNDKNDINEEDDDTGTMLRVNEEENVGGTEENGPATLSTEGEEGGGSGSGSTAHVTSTTTTLSSTTTTVTVQEEATTTQITTLSSSGNEQTDVAMEDGEM